MTRQVDGDGGGEGPMRAKMVAALAEFLDIDYELSSKALHHVWEQTKDIRSGGGTPITFQPDVDGNPGHALAHRVQMALTKEFDGDDLFPAVVVVQAREGHVGLAATAIEFNDVEWLLRMGIGSARRALRHQGDGS